MTGRAKAQVKQVKITWQCLTVKQGDYALKIFGVLFQAWRKVSGGVLRAF
jgi:hypothetical protein